MPKFRKTMIFILTIFLLLILTIIYLSRDNLNSSNPNRPIKWGTTFSWMFSEKLGFNPQKIYLEILDDLQIKNLRLIAYWPEIEPEENQYHFGNLDWQINEAQKRNVKIILTIGLRLPRWPECHEPQWVQNQKLNIKNQKLLNYITQTINRYKNNPAITGWQIENEPFLPWGECPNSNPKLLNEEIALVRSLDPNRPIIITDSGELSLWLEAAKRADIFGTTMYRKTYTKFFGYATYPLPPGFFRLKERLLKLFVKMKNPVIVIELQAEPWSQKLLYETSAEDDIKQLKINELRDILDYAKKTGFNEYYLWGAEWWYKMKESGHPEYWEEIKQLTNNR